MDLHTAGHRQGVVCAPHHAAAEAGRAIIAEGGNALEAMVAMAATIAAVYPHMNHIGGDGFWLVREPVRTRARHHGGGPGRRERARPSFTASHESIPPRGPLAALTVPGAVGGWTLALEAAARASAAAPAARRCCSRAAIRHARDGYVVDTQPGAAHRRKALRAEGRAGLRADLPASTASRRRRARS